MLSALVSCVEDTDDKVALEAITGVLKVVQVASEETVAPILVNICYRIRSGFDRNVTEMRAAAFKLFGALARFGQGGAALDQFYEHIHLNLPCLVLHVNDEQVRDRRQCFALSAFSSLPSSLSFSRSCCFTAYYFQRLPQHACGCGPPVRQQQHLRGRERVVL